MLAAKVIANSTARAVSWCGKMHYVRCMSEVLCKFAKMVTRSWLPVFRRQNMQTMTSTLTTGTRRPSWMVAAPETSLNRKVGVMLLFPHRLGRRRRRPRLVSYVVDQEPYLITVVRGSAEWQLEDGLVYINGNCVSSPSRYDKIGSKHVVYKVLEHKVAVP